MKSAVMIASGILGVSILNASFAFAQAERDIDRYVKMGYAKGYAYSSVPEGLSNAAHMSCLKNLQAAGLADPYFIVNPKNSKMLMLESNEPVKGIYVYSSDKSYFLKMDETEVRKFERCRRKDYFAPGADAFSFELDLGDGQTSHMVSNGHYTGSFEETNEPNKKQVPFTCTAKVKELSATAEANDRLNAYVVNQLKVAKSSFLNAKRNLASAKKDYLEAAKRPNPFGKRVDDWWMDSHYGEPIVDAAARANPSKYRSALNNCMSVKSDEVKNQVTSQLEELKAEGVIGAKSNAKKVESTK